MINYGFIPSRMDGTEHTIKLPQSLDLPASYSYEDVLPPVIDQGSHSICVPCSISAFLNWRVNLNTGEPRDNNINLFKIYNSRPGNTDGMTYKDAFHFLKTEGVPSDAGNLKIHEYAKIRNIPELKYAILANGPCFSALPVYHNGRHFWNRESGYNTIVGYHAISLVGYTEDSFIIRNSWGRGFGDNGYTEISDRDFGKLLEAWTIVG